MYCQCPTKIWQFWFPNFHVILPDATKYAIELDYKFRPKKLLQSKIECVVWGESAGLQGWRWITVHQIWFYDRQPRSQNCHSGETLNFLSIFLPYWYFLLSSLLMFSFSYFKIKNKALIKLLVILKNNILLTLKRKMRQKDGWSSLFDC